MTVSRSDLEPVQDESSEPLLTVDELTIVSHDPSRQGDLEELVDHIHALQNSVMAQAAARAYPQMYRQLGSTIP